MANVTDGDYRAVAMSSGMPHRPPARLLCGAVVAALLASTVSGVAAASAPGAGAAEHHHPQYLRVATWNVSSLLTDGKGSPHRRWKDRRTVVVRQLLAQAPVGQRGRPADVIALQEANAERKLPSGRTQYTDLVHRLNVRAKGRDHFRAIRPSLQSRATRIVYNAHSVRLLKAGVVRWHAQEGKVDGPRMMAWARFQHLASGKRFLFASVHLETASKRIRIKQWKQLVRIVPKLAHGRPVVVAGDFNSTRNQTGNAAAKLLPKMRRAGFGDTLGQYGGGALATRDARPRRVTRANFNSVNFYQRKLGHSSARKYVGQDVDYIFATNRLRVRGWSLVADLRPGSGKLHGVIPSDHNLVRAKLVIKR